MDWEVLIAMDWELQHTPRENSDWDPGPGRMNCCFVKVTRANKALSSTSSIPPPDLLWAFLDYILNLTLSWLWPSSLAQSWEWILLSKSPIFIHGIWSNLTSHPCLMCNSLTSFNKNHIILARLATPLFPSCLSDFSIQWQPPFAPWLYMCSCRFCMLAWFLSYVTNLYLNSLEWNLPSP